MNKIKLSSLQAIFRKPCRIVDDCCEKNSLNLKLKNFKVNPTYSDRVTAILDFCYNIFHAD